MAAFQQTKCECVCICGKLCAVNRCQTSENEYNVHFYLQAKDRGRTYWSGYVCQCVSERERGKVCVSILKDWKIAARRAMCNATDPCTCLLTDSD